MSIPPKQKWRRFSSPTSLSRLEVAVHLLAPEFRRPLGSPDVGQLVPVARLPGVADAVHVGVVLDPAPPGIAEVVEQVGGERVASRPEAFPVARLVHAPGAEADVVDAVHLEARVLEAAVRARDQPEAMVVAHAVARRHERDLALRPVGGAQAERLSKESL